MHQKDIERKKKELEEYYAKNPKRVTPFAEFVKQSFKKYQGEKYKCQDKRYFQIDCSKLESSTKFQKDSTKIHKGSNEET